MTLRRRPILLLVFVLFLSVGFSQIQFNDHIVRYESWVDATIKYHVSQKIWVGGDFGTRGIIGPREMNLIYFRPTVSIGLSDIFTLSAAVGSFNSFHTDITNTYELRLTQDVVASWPDFGWIKLYQRVRLDERFFAYQDSVESDVTFRIRYALGCKTKNVKIIGPGEHFFFGLAWEIFIPVGQRAVELFSNNQRFSAVVGYELDPRFEFQFHYILQRSRVFLKQSADATEHVFRFRLLYTMNPQ